MKDSIFQGRRLLIATKHKKELVIAPLLEKQLGVICFTNNDFDTDVLGTFTGEIERQHEPIETARQKCLMAMEQSGCDLVVASEGSFGPHPSMIFVSADEEFLMFIDKKNDLEIVARELSMETNFNGKEIANEMELMEFADLAKFPSHALILRKSPHDNDKLVKGIIDKGHLIEVFQKLLDTAGSVFVETDMRALFNPSRMAVIESATKKLLLKITSLCPSCSKPGFGITDATKGLLCSLCGAPTNSTLSHIYVCQHCQYFKEERYPNKETTEDPMYCDYCNP
jgi:hypothetical protein